MGKHGKLLGKFPVVQIEYSVELSLGGMLSSANFTRLFYHKQVRRLLEEWKYFARDPVNWLDNGEEEDEKREILEEALFKDADHEDLKDYGKLWGTNKRVSAGGHVTRLAPKTFARQGSLFEPKKVERKAGAREKKKGDGRTMTRDRKQTNETQKSALKQSPTYSSPDGESRSLEGKGPMSGLHQISQNQKAISKEQKKIFDMRNELKKMKEELSKQAMYSQQGDRPSKAAERRESRRMSQLNMDHVLPSGASLGSGGVVGVGGSGGKKKPSFAYTGENRGKSGGGKEDVTIAMSNLSVSGAQPKDEEEGGGRQQPLTVKVAEAEGFEANEGWGWYQRY
ncbi:hypothetical protein TL16_g07275 [Triparma laevis f. inornata]|uniref:Uncharacterized protein n=2 Tax=Triparma laevis TaxID=1534972 RepID=A0A9W7EFM5_9STRA|nr:hypothetical protein TL16_g07275 [Triparma laevis f. inornata]